MEASLLESAKGLRPEMAVVDLSLPLGGGILWIKRLHDLCPEMKVVLLSVHDEPEVRQAAEEAGADGFLLKRSLSTDLIPTVESLLATPDTGPS